MSYSFIQSAGIIYPNIVRVVVPTLSDVASFAQALMACVVFMLIGRLIMRRHVISELALFVGSAVAMVIIFASAQLGLSLFHGRILVYLLAIAGLVVAFLDGTLQKKMIFESTTWRIFVMATPVWACLISLELWQSDTLNSWVPNYQYLARNHTFPGYGDVNSAVVNSLLCYPLLGYVGSIFQVSPKILMHLNILFSLASLAFLVRVFGIKSPISWRIAALCVPSFFILNYHYPIIFSSYADLLMSILLGIIVYTYARLENPELSTPERRTTLIVMVLIAAEIILLKASGMGLVALWFASVTLVHGAMWCFNRKSLSLKKLILPVIVICISLGIWGGMQWWLTHIAARNQVYAPSVMGGHSNAQYLLVTVEMLQSIVSSPVVALSFIAVIGLALLQLKRRKTTVHALLLYSSALLILGYIALRILIFILAMNGVVTSEQRYSYHLFYAALVTLALTLPHMKRFQKIQDKISARLRLIPWKQALAFYALFIIISFPFIRNDVRERKLFMHKLASDISQAIDEAAADEASPVLIRLYFGKDLPHANHYGALLRGLIAVARPTDIIETVEGTDIIPAEDLAAKEYSRDKAYTIEFCAKEEGGYRAHLIHADAGGLRLVSSYRLPRFEDSKVQICE